MISYILHLPIPAASALSLGLDARIAPSLRTQIDSESPAQRIYV